METQGPSNANEFDGECRECRGTTFVDEDGGEGGRLEVDLWVVRVRGEADTVRYPRKAHCTVQRESCDRINTPVEREPVLWERGHQVWVWSGGIREDRKERGNRGCAHGEDGVIGVCDLEDRRGRDRKGRFVENLKRQKRTGRRVRRKWRRCRVSRLDVQEKDFVMS